MKRHLLLLLTLLLPILASAYDAKINGISYNFSGSEAEVTYSNNDNTSGYSGSVVIPESVTYGGKTYSVTSIGNSAFGNCSELTSVSIPESVTNIDLWAFSGCSAITSITIPHGVTNINPHVFQNCTSLTSITIPSSVISIGIGAFYGCTSLTSIAIPNDVTSIGNIAFQGCRSLTSITIPEGLTKIGYGTFLDCSSLTSVIIPKGVTSIGGAAFEGCSSLTSVSIPNGVTNIDNGAFEGCSSLTDVYCYAAEPPGVRSMFEDEVWDGYPFNQYYIKEHTTLHVPASSMEKYRTALRWSDFWKIVPITGTSVKDIPFSGKSNYFDLQGRKLDKIKQPGIYIENGKEILIK